MDEALRDAGEALKLLPGAKEPLACRADIYFNAGEFDRSLADYSKAIRLGATVPRVFYLRGMSNYFAGRLEAAADDFARASEAGDRESQVYSDLWLTWTSRRLGRPIPEAVTRRAAAQPRGDWPRPALAVLTGTMTPDEMLKILDGKNGDDRHMALSEGYFYLGQQSLVLGDESKAREWFEKARQLQVILYAEHIAAGFKLQRLNAGTTAGSK
jgi:lipoprotein NlpI